MRKNLLLLVAIVTSWVTAMAVPAEGGVRVFSQSDGTTVSLELQGDEWHHSYVTTDGLTVIRNSKGDFVYRTAHGMSNVLAHNASERTAAEQQFVTANASRMTLQALFTAEQSARRERAQEARKVAQVPPSGSTRVPVVLVNYQDKKFKDSDPKAVWTQELCAPDAVSVYQYFKDQSMGQFTPQFDIYGPYELSGNRATYGGNDSSGRDVGVGTMVGEACLGLDDTVDWSQYDNDGDGVCDVVIVLYAGDGEASSRDSDAANSIWPMQWSLSSSDYGHDLNMDGVRVSKFAVFNELYGSDLTRIAGIGTMCHEFSHCLGLPDFYATDYSQHFGMGLWSILDTGCYNNNGFLPCGYTAYERNFLGWMDYADIYPGRTYTTRSVENGGQAYKVTSDDPNEYYVIETIEQNGWNQYAVSSGLQVTHVNYNSSTWASNTVNNYDVQGMTIIPADNSLLMYQSGSSYYKNRADQQGDLWPYNGANELTATSTPAATLYNSSDNLDKPITGITKNSDGSVTFNYIPQLYEIPIATDATGVGSKTATAHWSACDQATSYSLRLTPTDYIHEQVLIETFSGCTNYWSNNQASYLDYRLDNAGWSGFNLFGVTGGLSIGCPYYGTGGDSSQPGYLTSPALSLKGSNGTATVAITGSAFYYSSRKDSDCELTVTLGDQSQTVTFATSDSETKVLTFDCEENNSQRLTLATTAADKRVMVTEVTVYAGNATRMLSGDDTVVDATIIDDITTNSYTLTGLEPNSKYSYEVMAHYGNNESLWSNAINFKTTAGAEPKSLKEMLTSGIVGNEYELTGDMEVVATIYDSTADETILLLKDEDGEAVSPVEMGSDLKDYVITGKSQSEYDQSNWIEVVVPGTIDVADLAGTVLAGGSVTGVLADATNPRLEFTSGTVEAGESAGTYNCNPMTPANFLGSQKGYFLMTPKANEMVQMVWAVYVDGAFYCPDKNAGNVDEFEGYVKVGDYRYNGSTPELVNGTAYQFQAIVKKSSLPSSAPRKASTFDIQPTTATSAYEIYPLDLQHVEGIVTAINGVNAQRGVASVRYYNLQGVQLDSMQPGINIIVTRYQDGSTSTVKIVK